MATQGFGFMGFSAFYSSAKKTSQEQGAAVFRSALDAGVTLFNTATFYGPLNEEGFGANLRLINHCMKSVADKYDRSKYQLMVKIGMDTKAPVADTGKRWVLSGKEDWLRDDVDYALKTLDTDYIDIIVLCRVPTDVTIEEAVTAMQNIVRSGKARHIGLSEAASETLKRANAIAPIYCIEQEWSLYTRDIEEEIVPTCRELGIKIVAYSPLGRGLLTGSIKSRSDIDDPYDFRLFGSPRFAEGGNLEANLALLATVEEIAKSKDITAGQVALAWLHKQGPDVIPIPGTTSITHLEENLKSRTIELSETEITKLNTAFHNGATAGDRYAHMNMTFHAQK